MKIYLNIAYYEEILFPKLPPYLGNFFVLEWKKKRTKEKFNKQFLTIKKKQKHFHVINGVTNN